MKRLAKISLVSMTILTTLWIGILLYAYASPDYIEDSSTYGEEPAKYGVLKAYFGEKMEIEPQEWNTTDELGIVFGERVEDASTETYHVLISDSEKALAWMDYDPEFTPYAVKYQGKFYRIVFLWGTPLIQVARQWELPAAACGIGWIFVGAVIYRGSRLK